MNSIQTKNGAAGMVMLANNRRHVTVEEVESCMLRVVMRMASGWRVEQCGSIRGGGA